MNNKKELPKIIKEISLQEIQRIDAALEGNWSPTVVTVWSREKGIHGFSEVSLTHPEYKPSLELYFKNTWVGIHNSYFKSILFPTICTFSDLPSIEGEMCFLIIPDSRSLCEKEFRFSAPSCSLFKIS